MLFGKKIKQDVSSSFLQRAFSEKAALIGYKLMKSGEFKHGLSSLKIVRDYKLKRSPKFFLISFYVSMRSLVER